MKHYWALRWKNGAWSFIINLQEGNMLKNILFSLILSMGVIFVTACHKKSEHPKQVSTVVTATLQWMKAGMPAYLLLNYA